jgi:glycine/D-amino acid oxidase-like deaminating enzyme
MRRFDVVVASMGGIGGSAAFHIVARGAKVLALDPLPTAHARGSSHGQARLIRSPPLSAVHAEAAERAGATPKDGARVSGR